MRLVEYAGTPYEVSPAHPAADALPWNLGDDEFAALVQNMREDGFDPNSPVTKLTDGRLIDGRRRELAAAVAGVEPVYRTVTWTDEEAIRWVERDLTRRNLSASQIAASAVELAALRERGTNQFSKKSQDKEDAQRCASSPKTTAEIAAETGVGRRTIVDAVTVKKKAPELLAAVKEGELSAAMAAKVAKLPKRKREKVAQADDPKAAAKEELGRVAAKVVMPAETDAWGIPVQPHAAEAFAAVPKFRELLAAIQAAARLFNEVANLPGGKFLTLPDVSSYRRGKRLEDGTHADRFVHEGLERAAQQVKNATPAHTVCPWHYADAPHPAECATCRGLNWTPPLSANVPPVCVERAKAAHGVAGEESA